MITYNKDDKKIVIPNGLGNINIVINQGGDDCPECPDSCNLGALVTEITENGDYVYYAGDEGLDGFYMADIRINVPQEGGECTLEDKWITPEVSDVDENGYIVTGPSEGYDGMSRVVTDPSRLRETWYGEGYEQGRAEGGEGGGESGGCTLTTRTITENGTYRPNEVYNVKVLDFSKNGAFDSGLKVVEDTTIEFYFSFKEERPDLMSFYGCEDSDWNDSTFAARLYQNTIEVKIGTFVQMFGVDEYGLTNDEAHRMKVGKNYGISIDDQMVVTADEINSDIYFTPSETRTIYIGAINSTDVGDDNGLNLFWRPFYGYIGPVTILGKKEDEEQVTYNYEPGDFGWWGEYMIKETQEIIKNIYTESGQVTLGDKTFRPNADGFSEVIVNVPVASLTPFDYTNDYDDTIYREAGWEGVDGFSRINIDNRPYGESKKEQGRNEVKANLKDLTVTQNNTSYTAEMRDVALPYLQIDGQKFLTDFTPILNDTYVNDNGFEIRIRARVDDGDNGGILIGANLYGANYESDLMSNLILRMNIDATCLWLGNGKTWNAPTRRGEWVDYRITVDGLYMKSESNPVEELVGWEVEPNINNNSWDAAVAIGGINSYYDGVINDISYSGKIAKVEFVQADTYTYVPDESGAFKKVETDSLLMPTDENNLPTYNTGSIKEGEYGWKTVTVNVPNTLENIQKQPISIDDYNALFGNYDPNVLYLIY